MNPFTINIPIYNEEEILVKNTEKLIEFLDKINTEYEIIIVTNGSRDRSAELGKVLENKYKQVRFFDIYKVGVGRAFKKAVQEAKYDRIISLDIDLSVDLSFVSKANELLDSNVLVLGSKSKGTQKRTLIRKVGSGGYIYLAKLLFGLKLEDFSIGAKGFKKEFVLRNLKFVDNYTNYVLNLAVRARKEKEKVAEIPIDCVDFRSSRFCLWKEGLYRYAMLFKMALIFNINRTKKQK